MDMWRPLQKQLAAAVALVEGDDAPSALLTHSPDSARRLGGVELDD